jgi:hypothetical protein
VDYPCDKHGYTKGVPLQGHFVSPLSAIAAQDHYDNHPAVKENHDAIEAKFAKEEKSCHIHLPRFLLYFIVGLMIHPIQWAWQKKSRTIYAVASRIIQAIQQSLLLAFLLFG